MNLKRQPIAVEANHNRLAAVKVQSRRSMLNLIYGLDPIVMQFQVTLRFQAMLLRNVKIPSAMDLVGTLFMEIGRGSSLGESIKLFSIFILDSSKKNISKFRLFHDYLTLITECDKNLTDNV